MDQTTTSSSSSSLYSSTTSLPTLQTSRSKPPATSTSSGKNRNPSSRSMGGRREKVKVFTPEMQDAQARGRDPFALGGESAEDAGIDHRYGERDQDGRLLEGYDEKDDPYSQERYGEMLAWRGNGPYAKETYERTNRMQGGAFAMDNPEVVIWHSLIRQESIPNTRHFFRKMMCGFYDVDDPLVKAIDDTVKQESGKPQANGKPMARDWDRQGRDWGSGYD